MNANQRERPSGASEKRGVAALALAATQAVEDVAREIAAESAALRAQTLHYPAAIDAFAFGLGCFDRDARLLFCNRQYAEAFGLQPDAAVRGATLGEIIACRANPETIDDYLAFCARLSVDSGPSKYDLALVDGGALHIQHFPLSDGGWVASCSAVEPQAIRALEGERLSLQTLIDLVPDNLWVKDAESRFIISNNATARRIGLESWRDAVGKTDLELCPPETAQKFYADERRIVASGRAMVEMEEYLLAPDGSKIWILTTKVPVRSDTGEVVGVVGISHDITQRKLWESLRDGQAEILEMIATSAPLESVLDRLARLVESQLKGVGVSVLLLDSDGVTLRLGAAPSLPPEYRKAVDGIRIGPKAGSCGTAVYRREPVIVADIMTDPLCEDFRAVAKLCGHGSCWSTPVISHRGEVIGAVALYSPHVREPDAVESRVVELATRMVLIAVERKLAEERIQFMATHDALTGLPNRSLLKDRLSQALLFAQRYNRWATVAFVDLDNFKVINDSLGHNAGDELLKKVACKMVECVRSTDTVVRIGGDEFVVLLFDQEQSLESVAAIVRNIQMAIAAPFEIAGHTLRVSSSIGVANYPNDGDDVDALLANADAAMYRAKELGRDNFQFYSPEMNVKVHDRFLLQEELRNAVARNEFVLHYQPQVDLRANRIFAVEALLRWRHPVRGLVSPLSFIPLAEETGLIVEIGNWVLREACRQNKAWQDAGLPPVAVSVNVSARQFQDKRLVESVAEALRDSGLDPSRLELELTESLIMQDAKLAVATMRELQGLGVQISIDDFGVGYSSLSALKTFPIARLKIDKSFINGLPNDEHDKAVASAVILLGQKLRLRVIAEGVETAEQFDYLRDNNCDEIQGFCFSKPIEAHELAALLAARGGLAPQRAGQERR